MQVHFGLDLLRPEWLRSVACIGTFDGVHLGHRRVIETAVGRSRERGLPAVLLTFDRHPASVLAPERCPPAVCSISAKLDLLASLGVAVTVVLPFDRSLASTSADQFYERVVRGALLADLLVVGHDFAFGHDRQGTTQWLADRIETQIVPPFELDGVRVSSSAVRRAVGEGRVDEAARWLGRPFSLEGVVVHGAHLGRKLGFPTANVARSFAQVTPADGVYAGLARTPFATHRSAISVGTRPTVGGTTPVVEAYLLDYKGESLYGDTITLEFERKLRDQVKFENLEALKEQMEKDVEAVRG